MDEMDGMGKVDEIDRNFAFILNVPVPPEVKPASKFSKLATRNLLGETGPHSFISRLRLKSSP